MEISKLLERKHDCYLQILNELNKMDFTEDESNRAIFVFLISVIENLEDAYTLIIKEKGNGTSNYLRSAFETAVFINYLSSNSNVLLLLKKRDYNNLKMVRDERIKLGIVVEKHMPNVVLEIAELNTRILELDKLIPSDLKKININKFESVCKAIGLSEEYTMNYRFLCRKMHTNIYELQERHTIESGLTINSKQILEDKIVYLRTSNIISKLVMTALEHKHLVNIELANKMNDIRDELYLYLLNEVFVTLNV